MRTRDFLLMGVIVFVSVGVLSAAEPDAELKSLADYLRYAAMHNAGLKASFESFRAATQAVGQAKVLPDPRFTYGYFIEEVETRVGPQKQKFGISQTFPWFGEIEARTDAAAMAAKAARQRYEADKLKLFYEVKNAYYEYAYLREAIETTEESLDLLGHFEEVARTKYTTSAGGHPDIIRAQIELATLADTLESLRELRSPMVTTINSVLNRKSRKMLSWPGRGEYEESAIDRKQVIARLRASSPELKSLDMEVAVAKKMVELAKKRYYPDVTLGVDWIDTGDAINSGASDSGKDAVMAMVSINLPLWSDGYRAGERQAKANVRRAAAKRNEAENDIISQAVGVLYEVEDSERKARLYGGILIPKGKEMLEASEAAYRGGEVDFLSLIDAQRKLLRFQLLYERSVTTAIQRRAKLDMLIGAQVKGLGNVEVPE